MQNAEILVNQEDESDSEIESMWQIFLNLTENYINSRKTVLNMFSKIQSLPDNGSISLNELIVSMSSSSRPNNERKLEMMEELRDAGIINFRSPKKNSFIITKGSIFSSDSQ